MKLNIEKLFESTKFLKNSNLHCRLALKGHFCCIKPPLHDFARLNGQTLLYSLKFGKSRLQILLYQIYIVCTVFSNRESINDRAPFKKSAHRPMQKQFAVSAELSKLLHAHQNGHQNQHKTTPRLRLFCMCAFGVCGQLLKRSAIWESVCRLLVGGCSLGGKSIHFIFVWVEWRAAARVLSLSSWIHSGVS